MHTERRMVARRRGWFRELRAHTDRNIEALKARIDKRFNRIGQELRDLRAELGDLRAGVKALGERVALIETHLSIGMPAQPQPA